MQRLRARLRAVALYFTRSSHRELLTRSLRPDVRRLRGTVLDVGGGRDSPLAAFWPNDATRIRVDVSHQFSPAVVGDAHALPFGTESVDGAVISEVLEHLRRPDLALSEIHRVLRRGGVLIGSVPFAIGIHADPHDYFRYTQEALELLLGQFERVDVRPHGNHFGVAWRAINERWQWLWILNPVVRPLGRRTNARWPVGYTFQAVKGGGSDAGGASGQS